MTYIHRGSLLLRGRYDRYVIALLFLLAIIAAVIFYRLWKKAQAAEQVARQHVAVVEDQMRQLGAQHGAELQQRAARAVAASRGSYDGHVAQQAFPYAAGHAYNPKDIFHFGGAMDYIVFDGLYDIRHNKRDPGTLSVVLVDVKWGSSRPTDVQRAVIAAVAEGRTRAEVWQARATPDNELNYNRRAI